MRWRSTRKSALVLVGSEVTEGSVPGVAVFRPVTGSHGYCGGGGVTFTRKT